MRAMTPQARIAEASTVDEDDRWLEEVVARALDGPTAADVARALMLAGYVHAAPRIRALWSGTPAQPPTSGWLAAAHSMAPDAFERNLDALHWLNRFMEARTGLEIESAYALFGSRTDGRAIDQGRARLDALRPEIPRAQLRRWNLDVADASERILGSWRSQPLGRCRLRPVHLGMQLRACRMHVCR